MTFANVLLFCLGGIAACAALVFVVETLVAFFLHEQEPAEEVHTIVPAQPRLVERAPGGLRSDKAA